jgi:hypothetical protein
MPYVVELEQGLLELSDEELYQELVSLRDGSQHDSVLGQSTTNVATWGSKPWRPDERVKYERRCPKTWRRVRATVEDCKTAEDCRLFLEDEMAKYETFRHRDTRWRQKRRQGDEMTDQDSSESESSEEENSDGETSDEASMVQKRRRQGERVRQMRRLVEKQQRSDAVEARRTTFRIQRVRMVRRAGGTSEEESGESSESSI